MSSRLTPDLLTDDLRERVAAALAPEESLYDLSYVAGDEDVVLVYREVPEGGIAVLGCSECIGRIDPPSIPFSAITTDETRHTPLAGRRLCRSCHSLIKIGR